MTASPCTVCGCEDLDADQCANCGRTPAEAQDEYTPELAEFWRNGCL